MSQDETVLPYSPEDLAGGTRTQEYIINALIGRVGTITICRVESVKPGQTGAVGTVDIKPLVLQMDGAGNPVDTATIFNVPYMRYQGGANAVIVDPKVGDLGICLVCSRDISQVKADKAEATPPTRRQYDLSDSLYIGGILNGAPSQYIHFLESGINVVSTGAVNIKGTSINLDAPVTATSTIIAAGDITDNSGAGNAQTMASMRVAYNGHTHTAQGENATTTVPNQQV